MITDAGQAKPRTTATQVRREPWTPARFKVITCDEHADSAYEYDAKGTEELLEKIAKEAALYD